MTPRQLIDLRGAGNAETLLRKMGKIKLTNAELIIKIEDEIDDAKKAIKSASSLLKKIKLED